MNLYVGTSGYSYKEWKGTFYPEKLPAKEMLGFYAGQFRTVEINNTFYRPPTASLLQSWAEQVPDNFRFALKAPQRITHAARLRDVGDDVAQLLDAAEVLGERAGPLLFQLPPNFRKDVRLLRGFLMQLGSRCRAAFEFRHESWFDDEVYGLLRDWRAALCVAEADDGPEVPCVATADWGYLRLRRTDYGDAEVAAWTQRVQGQNWREAFVYFKHEDEGKGPQLATKVLRAAA